MQIVPPNPGVNCLLGLRELQALRRLVTPSAEGARRLRKGDNGNWYVSGTDPQFPQHDLRLGNQVISLFQHLRLIDEDRQPTGEAHAQLRQFLLHPEDATEHGSGAAAAGAPPPYRAPTSTDLAAIIRHAVRIGTLFASPQAYIANVEPRITAEGYALLFAKKTLSSEDAVDHQPRPSASGPSPC